jgi:DNA-binding transcriptional regulator WhiA
MKKLGNYILKLNDDIKLFGISHILRKIHKENPLLLKKLEKKIHKSTYYYWLENKTPVAIKFLKELGLSKNLLNIIFNSFDFVSTGRKKCILPKVVENNLAYLIGVLHGDGSLNKNSKYITVTTNEKEFLSNVVNKIFHELFRVNGNIIEFNDGRYYRLEIGSISVHSFLSMFCPVGKKKGVLHIPEIILRDKELLSSYISGLFDTDGCLTHVEKERKSLFATFTQADSNFISEVYSALHKLDINVNKPRSWLSVTSPTNKSRTRKSWRIYVGSKKVLYDLLRKIEFRHPKKKLRASLILQKLK